MVGSGLNGLIKSVNESQVLFTMIIHLDGYMALIDVLLQCYISGKGVPKDEKMAFYWFRFVSLVCSVG